MEDTSLREERAPPGRIRLDYRTLPDPYDVRVTVRLWNAPVAEALDRITSEVKARWFVRDGCVVVAGTEDAGTAQASEPPLLPDWEKDIPAWKQEEEAMRTTLAATPISLRLDNATLAEMTTSFQTGTAKLVVIDDGVDAGMRVSFQVSELDPSQMLDLLCRMVDVAW